MNSGAHDKGKLLQFDVIHIHDFGTRCGAFNLITYSYSQKSEPLKKCVLRKIEGT